MRSIIEAIVVLQRGGGAGCGGCGAARRPGRRAGALTARSAGRGPNVGRCCLSVRDAAGEFARRFFCNVDDWGCEDCSSAVSTSKLRAVTAKIEPVAIDFGCKTRFYAARKTKPTTSFHPSRDAIRPFARLPTIFAPRSA